MACSRIFDSVCAWVLPSDVRTLARLVRWDTLLPGILVRTRPPVEKLARCTQQTGSPETLYSEEEICVQKKKISHDRHI